MKRETKPDQKPDQKPDDIAPAVAVVLHDVAPATWPLYADFVARLDVQGDIPLTLLVVPDFHQQGRLDQHPDFVTIMNKRLARGDELVLHGYYHADPGPVPWRPKEWFMRRIFTHEGEFYRLSRDTARRRLEQGLELFRRLDWPVQGFVPPAWLLGPAAREALAGLPLAWTSEPRGLITLPDFALRPAPTLVWSARSAWRRFLSLRWNRRQLQRHAGASLLRLGLHPVDMRFPGVQQFWLDTLAQLREQRRPVTKSCWLLGPA